MNELEQKLANYRPAASTVSLVQQTPILLLVGVSGAGKDTLKQALLATGQYHHIVSHTTRPPRVNDGVPERDGVEYHFVTDQVAQAMIRDGAFVEAKAYSGNVYGTSVDEIALAHDSDKIAVTDLEVEGVAEYKAIDPNVLAVFIVPPSYDVWQSRIKKRYGNSIDPADYSKRMQTAAHELQKALTVDYFKFVISDDIGESVAVVESLCAGNDLDESANQQGRQVAEDLLAAIQRKAT